MYDSYEIVEAIRKKIESEHENGYEVEKVILSNELYQTLSRESEYGSVEKLMGYPVEIDDNVKLFSLLLTYMLN